MARPKVIVQLYPMLPTEDRADRERKRPLGRNSELYNKVLHEWTEIVEIADQMGVWGISTIEHHLHSEGYEVGPNPGVLNAYWAAKTKHAFLGALGYVMATQDPIRVAEETAILDHLTKGRFFCGLARGYQARWANILGQFTDSVATLSDGSASDQRNREIFEERTRMLLRCWTEDSLEAKGEFYKIPYPYESGVQGYPAWASAQGAGTQGEIGPDHTVRRIAVVPKPYQQPHPPVFVAVSNSADSMPFLARNSFRPTYFSRIEKAAEFATLYVKYANEAGIKATLGERQNLVRWLHFSNSEREYHEQLVKWEVDIYQNFYSAFFPQMANAGNVDWANTIKESGIYIGGTLEEARDQWQKELELLPSEYITLIWHYAQVPKAVVLHELEIFMTKVLPTLNCNAADSW